MLQDRFHSASVFMAKNTRLGLSTDVKLAVYADYKLATEGLCNTPQPSLIEFEKRAKWKAWKSAGDELLSKQQQLQDTILSESASSSLSSSTTTTTTTTTASTATASELLQDISLNSIQTLAMISYIQRVEQGQWGWVYDPSIEVVDEKGNVLSKGKEKLDYGDADLEELQDYLGTDPNEISAEELLERPYVPDQDESGLKDEAGYSMASSGISTMAGNIEEPSSDDEFVSAKQGTVETLREAIKTHPDLISKQDKDGMTMLHWACDRGHLEKVEVLVKEFGANVNVQDHEGSTPLHFACLSGWTGIVEFLKSCPGIDLGIKDDSGSTAEEYLD